MRQFYFTNQTVDMQKARDIELKIESRCPGLNLLNPFWDGENPEGKMLVEQGKTDLHGDQIVGADLRKIRQCDGLVALMTSEFDIGSCMEIAICAFAWGKPVYVIALTPYHKDHPWIQYFATRVFGTVDGFIDFAHEKLIDHEKEKVRTLWKEVLSSIQHAISKRLEN